MGVPPDIPSRGRRGPAARAGAFRLAGARRVRRWSSRRHSRCPVIEYLSAPHGQWDAWAIWNQKARFFYRAGDGWAAWLAIFWAQPGHPVLVSLSVARLWAYAGEELTVAPALLSGVYGATALAVVMGTLNVARTRAWVAGSVLVAPFAFSHLVAAQTADLPVSMLVVASLAMLRQDDPRVWRNPQRARSALLLAGLLASLAVWTKNEGAVFLAASALLVAWIALRHGHARDMVWWVAGAAPVLAVVAWFKLVLTAARVARCTVPARPRPLLATCCRPTGTSASSG